MSEFNSEHLRSLAGMVYMQFCVLLVCSGLFSMAIIFGLSSHLDRVEEKLDAVAEAVAAEEG